MSRLRSGLTGAPPVVRGAAATGASPTGAGGASTEAQAASAETKRSHERRNDAAPSSDGAGRPELSKARSLIAQLFGSWRVARDARFRSSPAR